MCTAVLTLLQWEEYDLVAMKPGLSLNASLQTERGAGNELLEGTKNRQSFL